MAKPDPNYIQIVVFGPGYGESILAHIGSGSWIIIDSCLNDDNEPAALAYLKNIGVDVSSEVKLIVSTHWHDDHIKGLSKILQECSTAEFAMSSALSQKEFVAFLIAHNNQPSMNVGRGGTEIIKCLQIIQSRSSTPIKAIQNRIINQWPAEKLSHGVPVELLALSPSDALFDEAILKAIDFFAQIQARTGATALPKVRLNPENKNDLSIATILKFGNNAVLLGADVEEKGLAHFGWMNIVNKHAEMNPKASLYKIPHHGSRGANYAEVWTKMLVNKPVSVVTPWSLGGSSLPSEDEIESLKSTSGELYITSRQLIPIKRRYSREVLKQIERSGVKIRSTIYKSGAIAILLNATSGAIESIELGGHAERV